MYYSKSLGIEIATFFLATKKVHREAIYLLRSNKIRAPKWAARWRKAISK